jgi:hypothetical protein
MSVSSITMLKVNAEEFADESRTVRHRYYKVLLR